MNKLKVIQGVETTEATFFMENQNLIWASIQKLIPYGKTLGIDKEELFSEGSVGFIKAYRNYDESYGNAFSTYAVPTIKGEVQRFLRGKGHIVRYARQIQELRYKIRKNGYGDLPISEIAELTGETENNVTHALLSREGISSLSEPVMHGEEKMTLEDQIGEDADFSSVVIWDFLNRLNDKEQIALEMKLEDKTQKEIGEALEVSQVQAGRIIKKIGEKYRQYEKGESRNEQLR